MIDPMTLKWGLRIDLVSSRTVCGYYVDRDSAMSVFEQIADARADLCGACVSESTAMGATGFGQFRFGDDAGKFMLVHLGAIVCVQMIHLEDDPALGQQLSERNAEIIERARRGSRAGFAMNQDIS